MRLILPGLLLLACLSAMKLFPEYQSFLNLALVGIFALILILARRHGLNGSITDWAFFRSRKSKVGLVLLIISNAIIVLNILLVTPGAEGPLLWLSLLFLPALPLLMIGLVLIIQEYIRVTPADELWGRPPWKRRP